MITIGEGLKAHLLSSSSWMGETLGDQIAALVGTRVFPGQLTEKATYPAITYARVSGVRIGTHLRGPSGLARPRFQVDCWDKTYLGACRLGSLCRRRLEGFTGDWSDDESPATIVHVTVLFEDERDLIEPEIHGGLYRHSADYFLFHSTAGSLI